jgi:hypothetical protein
MVDYEKIHIPDLPTTSIQIYFDRLADRIEENLQQGKKTLVHCYVGRSRSASIILGEFEVIRYSIYSSSSSLAYLMKYRQMSLRDAFYYLRSRRSIVGPNFGFIKQLINYEKSLFGTTSVSFIDTTLGSIPDIYLSMNGTSNSRRETSIPIQITRKTTARPNSFIERSTISDDNSRIMPSINHSSFLHDQPRLNSASIRERFPSVRLNALRTGKYVPPFFNRYYLP